MFSTSLTHCVTSPAVKHGDLHPPQGEPCPHAPDFRTDRARVSHVPFVTVTVTGSWAFAALSPLTDVGGAVSPEASVLARDGSGLQEPTNK